MKQIAAFLACFCCGIYFVSFPLSILFPLSLKLFITFDVFLGIGLFLLGCLLWKTVAFASAFFICSGRVSYIGKNAITLSSIRGHKEQVLKLKANSSLFKLGQIVKVSVYGKKVTKIFWQKLGKTDFLIDLREKICRRIEKSRHEEFYKAILIGDRSFLSVEKQEKFKNSGLFHLLSISGLHFNILIRIVRKLCRQILGLSFWLNHQIDTEILCQLIAAAVGFFYLSLTFFSFPAWRAFLMSLLPQFSSQKKKVLFLVCGAMLVVSPSAIKDWSFLLSFLCTFALLSENKNIKIFCYTAAFFGKYNLFSFFTNAIAIPFFSLILPLSFISVLLPDLFVISDYLVDFFYFLNESFSLLPNALQKIFLFSFSFSEVTHVIYFFLIGYSVVLDVILLDFLLLGCLCLSF